MRPSPEPVGPDVMWSLRGFAVLGALCWSVSLAALAVSGVAAVISRGDDSLSPGADPFLSSLDPWTSLGIAAAGAIPLIAVFAPTAIRHAAGLGLPGPHPITRFTAATSAAMSTMYLAHLVTRYLVTADTASSAESAAWQSNPPATILAASIEAGATEEVTYLLVPTILTLAALVLVANVRADSESLDGTINRVIANPTTWWICIAISTFGLLARYAGHLYQGTTYAIAAAAWGAGLLALYAIFRSIWPIILGHTLYDFLIVGILPQTSSITTTLVLAALAAILIASTTKLLIARDTPRPAATTAPASRPRT